MSKFLSMNGGKLPQNQLNKFLADFVYDEDGEKTLLMIYYAGHGLPTPEPGGLRLTG